MSLQITHSETLTKSQLGLFETSSGEHWRDFSEGLLKFRSAKTEINKQRRRFLLKEAVSSFTKFMNEVPDYELTYSYLGISYCMLGRYRLALKALNLALEKFSNMNYAALYLYRGYANEHSGNPKKALADYSEAIHINPAYYDAYYLRSSLCFKMKKFNTVILDTTTAINLPSELKRQDTRFSGLSCVDDNVLRNLRADACFFSGDYRNAANDYTLLLGSRNYSAEALRKKAECLYHLGSFTEAVKIFTRVLERDPYSAEAYFLRGSIYLNDEQYELAENDFTKSISLLLNNTKAYIRRAYAESFNGRHTDALKDLETAKALEPDNPELLRTYGVVFLNMKMKVKAIDYFRRAANTGDTVSSNWLKRNK